MNAHAFIPTQHAPEPEIDLLEVEDAVNNMHTATRMVHTCLSEFLSQFVGSRLAEDANAASYAIYHLRDMVQVAHDQFHRYLQQEFKRDRERKLAAGDPDPAVCPSWVGDGIYRLVPIHGREVFAVRWMAEHHWFDLTVPVTGARFAAFCPEMFQQLVVGREMECAA